MGSMMTSIGELVKSTISFGQKLQNNAASAWGTLYKEMGVAGKVNKASQKELKEIVQANLASNADVELEQVLKDAKTGLRQKRLDAFGSEGLGWGISGDVDSITSVFDRYELGSGSIDSFNKKKIYAFKELGGTEQNWKEAQQRLQYNKNLGARKADRTAAEKLGPDATDYDELLNEVVDSAHNNKVSPQGTFSKEYSNKQNAPIIEKPRTQTVLSEDGDPLTVQYQASESEKLGAILSNNGDESANYLVSDKVQSTVEQAPSLKFASEQDPKTMQRPSLLAQKRVLTQNKENVKNNVHNALKNAMDNQEKQAFKSGQDLLNKSTEDAPWSSTAKAALGTAVAGGALMAALSSSRGQQNNAQLYGQQPLY